MPLEEGLALEARADRAAVPLAGRDRGPDRVRREARAEFAGRVTHGRPTDRPALERGIFVDGAVEPVAGETLTITNPATGELVGRATTADAAAVDRAVRAAHAAQADWARRGYADRGAHPARLRRGASRRTSTSSSPMLVAEQGKTIREARIELHKAADTLEHYAGLAEGGPRRVRARPRPGRRRARAAPAARRRRGDRAVELPDDAAVQQARPGAAVRQHGRRQAGRHDAAHDAAAGRDPHRGRACRRACSTSSPGTRRRGGRGARHPPARAQGRVHRLDADRRARHGARREGHQARDARARRLGPDDHLRRRRPREGGERGRAWAASTTAARRAWRSSASTSSSRSPTR